MSANDEILIIQTKNDWKVYHHDCDGCYNNLIGKAKTLEEAVDVADNWKWDNIKAGGFPPEYGYQIIKFKKG